MKTYEVTLTDDTAALVDRMLEDGPWESIDELFVNSIGSLQEDVSIEESLGMDEEELRRRLKLGQDDIDAGRTHDGEEVFREILARIEENVSLSQK